MNKLRVSFSILKMWQAGRVNDMVNSYFKLAQITNPYMEEGKKYDELVNKTILETKRLPDCFGGDQLSNPITQLKWEVPFENYTLVGIPDILDLPILYENKTGSSKDSGDYSADFQVAMYFFMAHLQGIEIQKALILHYNQYTKELDKSLIYNTEFERERAKNYILTLAPEIENYFIENDLWKKYAKVGIDTISKDMII